MTKWRFVLWVWIIWLVMVVGSTWWAYREAMSYLESTNSGGIGSVSFGIGEIAIQSFLLLVLATAAVGVYSLVQRYRRRRS